MDHDDTQGGAAELIVSIATGSPSPKNFGGKQAAWPFGRWGAQTWMLEDQLFMFSGQTMFLDAGAPVLIFCISFSDSPRFTGVLHDEMHSIDTAAHIPAASS